MDEQSESTSLNLGLAPVIQSIEICRDHEDLPGYLRLRGSNLLPSMASQVIVDGAFSSGFPAEAGENSAEVLVRIPDLRVFKHNRAHQLIYTTPYGMAIKRF